MHRRNRVFVTGAGGFIGSHLCEKLVKRGYKVKALVRYNSTNAWGWLEQSPCKKYIEVVAGDILNRDKLLRVMEKADIVFHLAALIGIPYSYHSPDAYVDTNIRGTLNILQVAEQLKIRKLIHTSTSEVYGTAQVTPISEVHPINPQSPYAASKASADFLALSFYRSFGLPVVVLRPFNTYGPRQSARAIIPTIITQILCGNKTIKLGALIPTRDFTYVEDTVEGFIKAAESQQALGEVINLGNNSEISIGDLASLLTRLMGVKLKIESEPIRERPVESEVERLWADNGKADKILKWEPKYSMEEGLMKTIKWFKANLNMYKAGIYNI